MLNLVFQKLVFNNCLVLKNINYFFFNYNNRNSMYNLFIEKTQRYGVLSVNWNKNNIDNKENIGLSAKTSTSTSTTKTTTKTLNQNTNENEPHQTLQEEQEDPTTNLRIMKAFEDAGYQVKRTDHAPVRTSEEAALIRGATLSSGAKAMLLVDKKKPDKNIVCVMSAVKKMDWKLLKQVYKSKGLNLAKENEVFEITGCIPGAVPPFGSLFTKPVKTLMDISLQEQGDVINFNCGLRTCSIQMSLNDYIKMENPTILQFAV